MLRKRGKVWYYQTRIRGRTVTWSTGETSKRKASRVVPRLRQRARLRAQRPSSLPSTLAAAIAIEVARIEEEVSVAQAHRVHESLAGFARWFGADPRIVRVTSDSLRDFVRERARTVARNTIEKDIAYVCRMLRQNGLEVDRPPIPWSVRSTPNRGLTDAEIERIFTAASERHLALYAVLLSTGARLAEIARSTRSMSTHTPLLASEIDWEASRLYIRSAKARGGKKAAPARSVRVPPEVLDLLRDEVEADPDPFAFRTLSKPWEVFDRCLRRAEIRKVNPLGEKVTLHSFRHTYATKAAEAVGHNPFVLQAMLGHLRITTTAEYCHPSSPDVTVIGNTVLAQLARRGCQTGCQVVELKREKVL